MYICKR